MPFYLYILMGFLLVSAGAMFYVLTRLNEIGSEQLVRVRKLVKNRKRKLNSFQHRVRLLESHMSEYMLSLGNEPARNLLDLKGILSTQATFVENIEFWLETRNLVALEESERVLQGNPPSFFEADGVSSPSESASMLFLIRVHKQEDWEKQSEELLQTFGRRIAEASRNAGKLGLKKRRDRRPTSQSLEEAGINLKEEGEVAAKDHTES